VPDAGEALVPVDALPATAWQAIVESTAAEIREGSFAKVVLARQARVTAPDAPFDAPATLDELRSTYSGGFIFAFTFPVAGADRTFLGATPERLVHLRHGIVETSSLAGSIRRGVTPEEDAALGARLLRDEKERTEHAVVAEMLRDALAPLCCGLSVPSAPTLLRLATVQHLFTPIRGALRNGQTILDLVERLHPTPAVGGFPRREALAVIRDREQLDRGWYAGPVGWLDGEGEGEFAVAIRSALLDTSGSDALLFAGCGIVGHSNPAAEYAESRLKMQAMLSALR
jgi:isochorismate synthase